MIFQHTWEAVLEGRKTQTRRIVKPKEILSHYMTDANPHWMPCVLHRVGGNAKWYAQHTYAVQPGRGKPAIIYNPNHPCDGVDIIEPGDSHYQWAKDGSWNYKGQGYTEARIRITDIRREDVRDINYEDVIAEGFDSWSAFCDTWCKMHDPKACHDQVDYLRWLRAQPLHSGRDWLKTRPAERYQAWVLTFELVTP